MTAYFTAEEFRCRCGRPECDAPTSIDPDLLTRLIVLRDILGSPVRITSGLRCAERNRQEGGVPESEHLTGEAADIACATSPARFALLQAAGQAGFTRIGIGRTFVHLDMSPTKPSGVLWLYP